jgi:hypothetical protein
MPLRRGTPGAAKRRGGWSGPATAFAWTVSLCVPRVPSRSMFVRGGRFVVLLRRYEPVVDWIR